MGVENEDKGLERELVRCGWCGGVDRDEKVYASPGDDIENPEAYHKDCFESLQAYVILVCTDSGKSTEQLMKLADAISGNKRRKETKKK